MSYEIDSIYSLIDDALVLRSGQLEIDEASHPQIEDGDMGPLHVTSGLLPGDFAVFLSAVSEEGTRKSTGYLVTDVSAEKDGSGIIVGGDLIERNPSDWVNTRLRAMWEFARSGGTDIGEEFGLHALKRYFSESE